MGTIGFTGRLEENKDGSRQRKARCRGDRGKIWEETAETGGHSCSDVETKCSGNFLESMKVIIMRTPSNGIQSQLVISCSQARIPVA